MKQQDRKLAFIGGGNMTRAIAGGLLDSGFAAARILISEPQGAARAALAKELPGVHCDANNKAVATGADCVVLAVKPQVLPVICAEIRAAVQASSALILSIAAGTRSSDIDAWLGGGLSVIRIMPNQPALLRQGVSGIFANAKTSAAERAFAEQVMTAVGKVVTVDDEADIDTVTAVSGSGPAYFFLLIDMLLRAGIELGLDEEAASLLAIETARGAAALAANEDSGMDELIARVRSPGGTTAAALDSLENANVRAIFSKAIRAARDRAVVLADKAQQNQD